MLPAEVGHNRFIWNLRAEGAESFPDMILWGGNLGGPKVPPGRYRAKFEVDGSEASVPIIVRADPRSEASTMDLVAQYEFAVETGETLTRAHRAIRDLRGARGDLKSLEGQLETLESEDAKAVGERIDAALEAMKTVEEALYQTKIKSPQDPLNYPIRLTNKLAAARSGAMQGEFRPTAGMVAVAADITARIEAELEALERIFTEELPAIDEAARALALPLVRVPDRD